MRVRALTCSQWRAPRLHGLLIDSRLLGVGLSRREPWRAVVGNAGKEGPLQFMVRGSFPVLSGGACHRRRRTRVRGVDARTPLVDYVRANAAQVRRAAADVADLAVLSSYKTAGRGSRTSVVAQRRAGLCRASAARRRSTSAATGRIVFAAGSLVKGLRAGSTTATLDAAEAVEAAAARARARRARGAAGDARQGRRRPRSPTAASRARRSRRSSAGRPADGQLRLAWQVVIDDASDTHLWNATVDARSGSLLDSEDLTVHDDVDEIDGSLSRASGKISKNFAPPAFTLMHAQAGQRRVQLPRLRVPDREPARRRPDGRQQPGRHRRLAVRLA